MSRFVAERFCVALCFEDFVWSKDFGSHLDPLAVLEGEFILIESIIWELWRLIEESCGQILIECS